MNGTAALALLPPAGELPAKCLSKDIPTDVTKSKPVAVPTAAELEIGEALARAAILVLVAMEQYQKGQSTLATNQQGAELIARLYELQQSAPTVDLAAAGKRALRVIVAQTPDAAAVLCQHNNLDRTLEEILSWPLGVLAKVTKEARTWAN